MRPGAVPGTRERFRFCRVRTGRFGCRRALDGGILGDVTIHGTKGILRLGDANQFGGGISLLPEGDGDGSWRTLEPVSPLSENCRGLGVADLGRCIRMGQVPLVSGAMACHVLDIVDKMMESGRIGQACCMETECERPAPFDNWEELF